MTVEKERHPYIMANLIQKHNIKIFAEIGVKNSMMFESIMRDIGAEIKEYWAIDRWEGTRKDNQWVWDRRHKLCCTLMTHYPSLRVLRMHAVQAASVIKNGYFDAVFLDTSHEYARTKNEVLAWIPKIKKGGLFTGHDLYLPQGQYHGGVKKALDEIWTDYEVVDDGVVGFFIKRL